MPEAEIRRNLQIGIRDVLRHTLLYGEVRILRASGMDEIKKVRAVLKEAQEIIEKEKARIKDNENKIFEDARVKGKKEGMDEFKNIIKNFVDEKEQLFKKIEETLMKRIVLICEKVLEKELSMNPSCIISIIRNEVKKVCQDNITVVLNNEDFDKFKKISPEFFAEIENLNVAISGDENIKQGECLLRCNSGEIDLSVRKRLRRLGEILENGD